MTAAARQPDRRKIGDLTDKELLAECAARGIGDIDQTRTLQNKRWNPVAADERDENDEQHISPLQLDVIERCIDLWSNPGDVVLTPFLGIGSEVYAAASMGRRGIGFELKPSYFAQAVKNLAAGKPRKAASLLDAEEAA